MVAYKNLQFLLNNQHKSVIKLYAAYKHQFNGLYRSYTVYTHSYLLDDGEATLHQSSFLTQ